jgi:hypothetical protein
MHGPNIRESFKENIGKCIILLRSPKQRMACMAQNVWYLRAPLQKCNEACFIPHGACFIDEIKEDNEETSVVEEAWSNKRATTITSSESLTGEI